MDNHQVVATLNKLLETTKDGESGFRTCAEGVTRPGLKTMFEAAARRCDEGATRIGGRDTEARRRTRGLRHGRRFASSRLDQHQIFNHWKGRTRGAGRMRAWRRRGKKHL